MKYRRIFAVATACLLALLIAACGSSSNSEKLKYDPAKADQIAHVTLIQDSDLGSGWLVEQKDQFDDPGQLLADTSACRQIQSFQLEDDKVDQTARVGRAQTVFKRTAATLPFPATVELEVEVYRESKTLTERLTRAQGFVRQGTYESCLLDGLKATLSASGLTVTTRTAKPTVSLPGEGFSVAVEADISGLPVPYRLEFYGWLNDNVTLSVTIAGPPTALSSELIKTVIDKTQAKLAESAK